MNGGLPAARSGGPDTAALPPARPHTRAHTAVLPDPQAPATEMLDWPSALPQSAFPEELRPRRRLRFAWVTALAAVVVALAGWLVAGAVSGPSQPPATATRQPQASPAASTPGPATVNVNAAALVGQPVGAVRQQLAGLGLRPRVVRSVTGGQRPGTVVSVQPGGQVAQGSVITVSAAVAPPGHRHHKAKHHGHGNGGGNGQGGD
jgi:serine/threonine-protein kinase